MAMFMQKKDTPAGIPEHMLAAYQEDTMENRALYSAAASANIELVRTCIANGGKPNWFNSEQNGATSLHAAARAPGNDAPLVVRELIGLGGDFEVKTITTQSTPLHEAILNNNQASAEALIEAGASFTDNSFGNSPLLLSAQQGNVALLLSLLKHGHNIHTTNNQQRNALHICSNLCEETPSLGMPPPARDPTSTLPTNKEIYIKITACLLMYGVNVNGKDANMYTPLHAAAARGNLDMVKLLVDSGADLGATSKMYIGSRLTERTPLEVADLRGHNGVCGYLKMCGEELTAGKVVATNEEKRKLSLGMVSEARVTNENKQSGNSSQPILGAK